MPATTRAFRRGSRSFRLCCHFWPLLPGPPSDRSERRPGPAARLFPTRKEKHMQVSEVMTPGVKIASPTDTLQQAARWMAELDTGILPVGENDRLVGMITDRD